MVKARKTGRTPIDTLKYNPVPFDPHAYATEQCATDPEFKRAFEAIQDEYAALDILLAARQSAGLTQTEVAARMGMNPASLARIESSLRNQRHSPSLDTLRRYARACGMRLTLGLEKLPSDSLQP